MLGPGNILIVGPRSGKVPQNKGWLDGIAEGTLPGDHALGVEVLAVGRAPSELVSKPRDVDLCEHEALRQQVRHPVQPGLQTVRPSPVADLPELARALKRAEHPRATDVGENTRPQQEWGLGVPHLHQPENLCTVLAAKGIGLPAQDNGFCIQRAVGPQAVRAAGCMGDQEVPAHLTGSVAHMRGEACAPVMRV